MSCRECYRNCYSLPATPIGGSSAVAVSSNRYPVALLVAPSSTSSSHAKSPRKFKSFKRLNS
jgi:hypothetical protein